MVDFILLFLKSGIGITWHWYIHVNVYLVFYNFVNASFTLYGMVTWLDDFCGFFPFVTGRSKRTVYIADKLRSILISFEIENNTCILHFNVMKNNVLTSHWVIWPCWIWIPSTSSGKRYVFAKSSRHFKEFFKFKIECWCCHLRGRCDFFSHRENKGSSGL